MPNKRKQPTPDAYWKIDKWYSIQKCKYCGKKFESRWRGRWTLFCTHTCQVKTIGDKNRIDGPTVENGWVYIWDGKERKPEHRVIAERVLGRKLKVNEEVHHINGNKTDNRHCNLLICSTAFHAFLHSRKRCKETGTYFLGH